MPHPRNNTIIAASVTALACLPVLPVPPAAAAQSGPDPVPLTSLAVVPATARLTRQRRSSTVRTRRSWLRWRPRASNANGRAIAPGEAAALCTARRVCPWPTGPAAMQHAYPERGGHVPPRARVRRPASGPPPSGGDNRAEGADRLSSFGPQWAWTRPRCSCDCSSAMAGPCSTTTSPTRGRPGSRPAAAGRLRRLSDRGGSASRPMLRPPVAHRVVRRILREFFGCAACVLRRPGLPVRHASIPLPASCRGTPGHPGMRPRGRRLRRIRQQRL